MAAAPIPPGKLPMEMLTRILQPFEPWPADVRLGPAVGEDACVLDVAGGALVAATDPITLTTGDLGRYAVLINANDVAACGVRPRWFLATVLLPVGVTERTVEDLFATMREALAEVGATLVGGHTEVTGAVEQPVIVGQMMGFAQDGRFVPTGGVRPGDVVVQVGPVPVEGAAVLAAEAADRLIRVSSDVLQAAQGALRDPGISVVEAAMAAAAAGATALHDPTEGGLASGLHELAAAAGVALRVDTAAVGWFAPGVEVCRALGADPWATLASGSLLAAFAPDAAAPAVRALSADGHLASVIAVAEPGAGVRDLAGMEILRPRRDEVTRVLEVG